jgi:transcriptional regulator EpsA
MSVDASEHLLRIVEMAPQVRRRYQFFLWSQGDLQRWLPHKLLVCGAYDRQARDLVFDVFNSVPLSEVAQSALQGQRTQVLAAAMRLWRQHRQQPCLLSLADAAASDAPTQALLQSGYQHLLVHGLSRPGRPEDIESFFLFGLPHGTYGHEALQGIDMLLPCLHMTYQRVHITEQQMSPQHRGGLGATPPSLSAVPTRLPQITEREREILSWVRDGLSNQQIGEKLGISALTVKNHIQKILRKLGAANRAQAVAKAMTQHALGMGLPTVDEP